MSRILSLLFAAALPAALFAPTDAHAWNHFGWVWMPSELPLTYYVADHDIQGLPAGYPVEAAHLSYEAWDEADCALVPREFGGVIAENAPPTNDGENRWIFDDPGDQLEPGVLARVYPNLGGFAFSRAGMTYNRLLDVDIVFNDNIALATEEEIETGQCSGGAYSMVAIGAHEVGHQLGLAHTCEQGEPCVDPVLRDATMYWTGPSCSTSRSTINSDDIAGISVLYGLSGTIHCSHELDPDTSDTITIGNVEDDFELKCIATSDTAGDDTEVTWYWGDGATSTGTDVSHTYTEAGNYTLRACFSGEDEACGSWDYCETREGYVRACATPEARFELSHVDGLTYKMLNNTDISVYGCIFDIQWDVFRDGELIRSITAWEPEITFDEAGEHRIVLNVGGPAGVGAAEIVFDAVNRRGEGYGSCSTLGMGGASGLVLLAGFLPLLRRRRSA